MREKIQKSIVIVAVLLIVTLFVVALIKDNKSTHPVVNEKEQMTLEQKKMIREIEIDGCNIVDGSLYIELDGCFKYPLNIESYVEQANYVVEAEIIDVSFVEVQKMPWTKLTIKIDKSFVGKMEEGKVITIYEMGGYVSGKSFLEMYGMCSNKGISYTDIVEMKYFQKKVHSRGEKGVFFINPRNGESIFASDTYELVCSSYSSLMYDEDKNAYLVRNGDEEYYAMRDELIEEIMKNVNIRDWYEEGEDEN